MDAYTVIWSGSSKQSIPGIGGIERRENYYMDAADPSPVRLTRVEHQKLAGDPVAWRGNQSPERVRCGCGRSIAPSQVRARITSCWRCRELRRQVKRRSA